MSEKEIKIQTSEQVLLTDLSQLIEQSKQFVIVQANSVMTMLFWNVGKRINEDVLQNKRADYGKQIVATLARQLTEKYGRNFERTNLFRMMKFADQFSDLEIVAPLAQQLSWSHFRELIPLKSEEARLFYAKEAAKRHWGKREQIELLEMHKDGIVIAEYWTELPPKRLLEQKIHEIVIATRELFERNKQLES